MLLNPLVPSAHARAELQPVGIREHQTAVGTYRAPKYPASCHRALGSRVEISRHAIGVAKETTRLTDRRLNVSLRAGDFRYHI